LISGTILALLPVDALARTLIKLDMAAWWQLTASNRFIRIKKEQILQAIQEATGGRSFGDGRYAAFPPKSHKRASCILQFHHFHPSFEVLAFIGSASELAIPQMTR
jgi:hypothetical protein